MRCPACQHENRDSAKFCEECAAPLPRACASCGSELRPSAKFCDECATPVPQTGARDSQGGGAAAQRGPARPGLAGAERSSSRTVVTIIFADLVGSTALHERLDAESVRQFMEAYYAAMRGAVEAHGGRVTQVMGDGVKAVFGAPRVAEDDAIRAVRAGVEMQRAFRELAEQQSVRVGKTGLRVAVNTGEVVSDGEAEIIGDPVNVAARLQEQGKDGDVVIGGSTQRLVGALVTLDRLGSFALKGRAERVEAYRVVSLEPPEAKKAAFVGREEELARLTTVYDTALSKPTALLAVLLGSPGLGKSRLIEEFAHRLGAGAAVLTAHCDSAGGATFAPLVAALREQFGIEDGVGGAVLRAAVEAVVPGGDAERARIVGGVAALLSGSPASPEETFFVIRRLLAALAASKPVVLVIDDLQWAEPLLLDLVEHLVQWGSGVPLLVLVGARPELRDLRSSLATPGGFVADVLTLSGLDAGAAMRLAAGVIGAADLPAALAAKLLATSEGNPLFVAELVKMLVQEGVLHRDGERWVTSAALADLEMPPTIHALLAARIERLRPEERNVLERAAVVGRIFSRSAVATLLRETGDLDARLEFLRRSELIERDTGWFLGEPVLRFHHVLIRDAAYRRVLKGTRAELHARLADWIEGKVGGAAEHDETIGRHLEQAHQHLRKLGPLDTAGIALGERAARRLSAAGRRALAHDDVALAASVLGRAIDCLPAEATERADLALDWCEALLSAGDVAPASAAIEQLARASADSPRLRAWHTCFAGQLSVLTAPEALHETATSVAAAAETLAGLGDAAGEAKAHHVHAQTLARLGQVGGCEAALDRALAAARRARDDRRSNAVLAGAPRAALWGPSPVTRASGRCLDVVRVLRITQGAPAVEAVALSCQGVLEALRGRTDAAKRMIASSRKMVEELGIAQRLFEADVFAGRVALLEGDAGAAEQSLRSAYDGLRDLGLGIDAAQAAALLARALLAQGRAAEAEALSHESEALAGDDLQAAIAWRGARAEALAQRGEHDAAVELAQAAVEIAAATDALLDHADARVALAAALRAAGRSGEADTEERRARELWEAKGATQLLSGARREGATAETGARAPSEPGALGAPLHAAPDGRLARPEYFGADREADVFARLDELSAEAAGQLPVRRRIRPNATAALGARLGSAVATRDAAALDRVLSERLEQVHHSTGTTLEKRQFMSTWRSAFKAEHLGRRFELLATLGASLALGRESTLVEGLAEKSVESFGPSQIDDVFILEDDGQGQLSRIEIFAADRLGNAITRLYERHAELLPDGPERARAAATAHSIAALMSANPGDATRGGLSSGVEFIDHRTVGLPSASGVDGMQRVTGSLFELASDVVFRTDDALRLEPNAVLLRQTMSGTNRASGGAFEFAYLALVVFGDDGLLRNYEAFDTEREAEAHARFDELTGETPKPRPVQRRVRPTATTRTIARWTAAFTEGDLDSARALLSDTLRYVDHPTHVQYGRDETIATTRGMLRSQNPRARGEVLATLGESLALWRRWLSASGTSGRVFDVGAYEREELVVNDVDEQGRYQRIEVFADDKLGDAVIRLYGRYAELLPESPARTRAEATARSLAALLTQPPDLERWNTALSDLGELVDRRSLAVFGSLERGAVRDLNRAMFELENFAIRIDDVRGLEPGAILFVATTSGTSRSSGGAFERQMLHLWELDGEGLVGRTWRFDAESEAEALAQFDAVVGGSDAEPSAERFANAASGADDTLMHCFNTRDWAGVLACVAPEVVFDERRRLTRNKADRQVWLEQFRLLFDVPESRFTIRLLATRGERLSLHRHEFEGEVAGGGGRLEMEPHLTLHEVDAEGRIVAIVLFDLEDLDAAHAELEACFAVGEEEPYELTSALTEAWRRRDWEAVAAGYARGFELHHHGQLGWGTLQGVAEWVQMQRALVDLAPDAHIRVDHVRVTKRAVLLAQAMVGTRDGGAFEIPALRVGEMDEQGMIRRIDLYDPDQLGEARARFAEIDTAPPAPFANAATRAAERMQTCWRARDWAGYADCLAPAFRYTDRRPLAQLELDRAQYVEFIRQLGDMDRVRLDVEQLATRGERLLLARLHTEVAGGDVGASELDLLSVHETDEHGAVVAIVRFEAADLGAAYAELDARYAAGEGGAVWAADRAFVRAVANRDWDGAAACCAPAIEEYDHRRLALLGTTRGAEAWLRNFRTLVELAPDTFFRTDHFRSGSRGFLTVGDWHGSRDGGRYEMPLVVVVELDEGGGFARVDLYDPEQLDDAHARLAEIAAGTTSAESPPEPFANWAARALFAMTACFNARDWAGAEACVSPGIRFDDRRPMRRLAVGVEGFLTQYRFLFDVDGSRFAFPLVATRGERLSLHLIHFTGQVAEGGGPLAFDEHLGLFESDREGRLVDIALLDLDDLDAAYAELDARYEAGEGRAPATAAWFRDFGTALERRDWDAVTALYAPGIVGHDHRLVSWGTLRGPFEFLETLRQMVALAPDAHMRGDHLRTALRGAIAENVWVGTRDGGAFESPFVAVLELDTDGRALQFDFYDPHHLDRAFARFDELRVSEARDPLAALARPTSATLALDRWRAASATGFSTGDWDLLRALCKHDIAFEDRTRRAQFSGDRELMIDSLRTRAEMGAELKLTLIGTAGDRAAISRAFWSGGPPEGRFEIEYFPVVEVADSGLFTAVLLFDDARAAQREAWARWARVDPERAAVAAPMGELVDAFNAHDRGRWRAQLADEIVVEDHRRASMGRLEGADAYADSLVALWELAPETTVEAGWRWPALDRHGAITLVRRTGVLPDGGDFESEYLILFSVSRGRITHIELFEVEDLGAALARFEELRPDPLQIPPNAATRAADASLDLDARRSLVSADFRFDDRQRRSLLSGDVETWIASGRYVLSKGDARSVRRVAGTLGERIALYHLGLRGTPDGAEFALDHVALYETDAEGRLRAFMLFDPEDRGAATLEALDRFGVGEAAAANGFSPFVALARAVAGRDWVAARRALAPTFAFADHRTLGVLGRLDPDQWIASLRALTELSPDYAYEVVRIHAWNRRGIVTTSRTTGSVPDGGPFENAFVNLSLSAAKGQTHNEVFDPADVERALARFEELCAARG